MHIKVVPYRLLLPEGLVPQACKNQGWCDTAENTGILYVWVIPDDFESTETLGRSIDEQVLLCELPGTLIIYLNKYISKPQVTKFHSPVMMRC